MFIPSRDDVLGRRCWSITTARSPRYTFGEHCRRAPRFVRGRIRLYIFQPVLLQSMQEECSFNECFVTVSSAERKGGQILFLAEVSVFSFRHCTLPITCSDVCPGCFQTASLRYCPSRVALQPAPDMRSSGYRVQAGVTKHNGSCSDMRR